MSIHSSIRPCKHRNRSQVRQTSTSLPSQCIEDDALTSSSQETGALSFNCPEQRPSTSSRYDYSGQHEPLHSQVSIASNGVDYFEDSVQTSLSPSMAGDSFANSPNHTPTAGEHQFAQYGPVCLYVFKQDTFPRNWCLRMISNPYPFHSQAM